LPARTAQALHLPFSHSPCPLPIAHCPLPIAHDPGQTTMHALMMQRRAEARSAAISDVTCPANKLLYSTRCARHGLNWSRATRGGDGWQPGQPGREAKKGVSLSMALAWDKKNCMRHDASRSRTPGQPGPCVRAEWPVSPAGSCAKSFPRLPRGSSSIPPGPPWAPSPSSQA